MNEKMFIKKSVLRKMLMIGIYAFYCTFSLYAQRAVTGTVTDGNGEPVIGASVSVKGSSNGTVTSSNGAYSLSNVQENDVLVFSYVGYITQEVKVTNQTTVSITLQEDTQELEELVVVGYGTQKKVTVTGAVSSVGSKEILTTKTGNVQNALSGKVAGLKIYQKTSEPGELTGQSGNVISLRGMGTPLVVVDGVPRDNFVRLDANEIESISLLKDASASIYGVRASNGVVLITTKKGQRNSKFRLDYSGYYGIQRTLKPERPLNALEYMELRNERTLNLGGTSLMYPEETFEAYLNGTRESTDWTKELRENVPQTYHSVSASGGTDKLDYFLSFGYNHEDGIWKSGDLFYNRFNLRSNVTASIAKGLKVEVLLNLMTDYKHQPGAQWINSANMIKGMYTQIPLNPYYANNNPEYPARAADNLHPEVVTYADKAGYQKKNQRLAQTNLALEWEVPWVKGLKARGMYSYDYKEDVSKDFTKGIKLYDYNVETEEYTASMGFSPTRLKRHYSGYINTLMQLSLSYAGSFNKVHNVSAMALYEESDREGDNFGVRREFAMDALDQLFAGNTTNQEIYVNTGINDLFHIAYKSLVGRVTYDYATKYMAEFAFRYDASSKNAPEKRWGFFPSALLGWQVAEEAFIKDSDALNFIKTLKLRATYGLAGDDAATNDYQFLTGYNYPEGGYMFGSNYVNALNTRGMPNETISWYESAILNFGLDVDLWNGLLGGSFEVFQRDRTGLLATRQGTLPGLVGANLPQENLNSDMTRGLELTLTHRNNIKNFHYQFSGNIAFSRTMTKYSERARANNSYEDWRYNPTDRWNNIWWGLDYTGQFQSYSDIFDYGVIYEYGSEMNTLMLPGDLKYADWNGDGLINGDDLHPVSINNENDPIMTYGFSLAAQYKQFDLNLQFQGTGMRWTRYTRFYQDQFLWDRNGLNLYMDRWHRADPFDPDSDEWIPGKYPSVWDSRGTFISTTNQSDPGPASSFWILNASYLRLKSLEFGYTLPEKISKKAGMQRARLFFNAYNLFTISDIKLMDPEHPTDNDGFAYPVTKTFNFGVNISF
jgi:TonB-linked SusC/RagA family outer membrane protein